MNGTPKESRHAHAGRHAPWLFVLAAVSLSQDGTRGGSPEKRP